MRTPEETLREAQGLLDAGLPFHAHEVLEDAWKACRDAGRRRQREQELWRGLAQLAVGLTHAARGNTVGGARLLLRGADRIRPYASSAPYGIDVGGLVAWAGGLAGRLEEDRDLAVDPVAQAPALTGRWEHPVRP